MFLIYGLFSQHQNRSCTLTYFSLSTHIAHMFFIRTSHHLFFSRSLQITHPLPLSHSRALSLSLVGDSSEGRKIYSSNWIFFVANPALCYSPKFIALRRNKREVGAWTFFLHFFFVQVVTRCFPPWFVIGASRKVFYNPRMRAQVRERDRHRPTSNVGQVHADVDEIISQCRRELQDFGNSTDWRAWEPHVPAHVRLPVLRPSPP